MLGMGTLIKYMELETPKQVGGQVPPPVNHYLNRLSNPNVTQFQKKPLKPSQTTLNL